MSAERMNELKAAMLDRVDQLTAERDALAERVRELEIIAEAAWEYNRCQNPIAAQSCRGKMREVLADYKSKQQRELESTLDKRSIHERA